MHAHLEAAHTHRGCCCCLKKKNISSEWNCNGFFFSFHFTLCDMKCGVDRGWTWKKTLDRPWGTCFTWLRSRDWLLLKRRLTSLVRRQKPATSCCNFFSTLDLLRATLAVDGPGAAPIAPSSGFCWATITESFALPRDNERCFDGLDGRGGPRRSNCLAATRFFLSGANGVAEVVVAIVISISNSVPLPTDPDANYKEHVKW